MALRSGLAAQFGIAEEVEYGTRVAPARFYEFVEESIQLQQEWIESQGIRSGLRAQLASRRQLDVSGASGSFTLEVPNKGAGLLLKHFVGKAPVVTTPAGGTTTRLQTFTSAGSDPDGFGLTIQVGRPDIAGTVNPFEYTGCKVTGWEISQEVGGLLRTSVTVDSQAESTAQTLASASYATGVSTFGPQRVTCTVGGVQVDIRNFTLTGTPGLATDRRFLRGSSARKEPIVNAFYAISGSMEAEFASLVQYAHFVAGDTVPIIYTVEGPIIEGALRYMLKITLAGAQYNGETPSVRGPDILSQPLPFAVYEDGTNPLILIEYQSVDTAA